MIYNAGTYSVYNNKIVQGNFSAIAESAFSVKSNYQSPPNKYKSAFISFKFAINGEDNEMLSGIDHYYIMPGDVQYAETPLIQFGRQLTPVSDARPGYIAPGAVLKIRLDMREVLKQFEEKGFYENFNRDKIYKEDFKGVYVAGGTSPLTWDFSGLKNYPHLKLNDHDGDGIYELELKMNEAGSPAPEFKHRTILKDLSDYPQLNSGITMVDAMYNLSLEEMLNAIEPDSTLRTGKEWAGVWTRDVSYSIILSMAQLQPTVSKISLRKKVNRKGQIIQDTGTGGAWPVSTDRMIWAVAAWEIYKVTGDKAWLREAFEVIKNSIETDRKNIIDNKTGLIKGESSFLDWREQTYPDWMEPADIFESINLGTNAVHYKAYDVASEMAEELRENKDSKKYRELAVKIKAGINKYLWQEEKGYYSQYLYGRINRLQSPRAEALGNALSIIFGIADGDKAIKISEQMPVTDFGIPCIFPQIPDIPPYHNNGIWPFVQAYWMLASAKAGNEKGVMESISAIYRPAALFLTNQENFVAENGDFAGTQINSANMLWSLSGNLSIIYKVLFGIEFKKDKISFYPFIPKSLQSNYQLKNIKYRNALLNIQIEGYGDEIAEFYVDGKIQKEFNLPSVVSGVKNIKIIMNNNFNTNRKINKQNVLFSPTAPMVNLKTNSLHWSEQPETDKFLILRNGEYFSETKDFHFPVSENQFAEYQVMASGKNGLLSFASEPILVYQNNYFIEAEEFTKKSDFPSTGFSGNGYVETSVTQNTSIKLTADIEEAGNYIIRFRYANGHGSVKTDNKSAVRKLKVNKKEAGIIVLPQRGKEEWSNWGWTNNIEVKLKKGKNILELIYTPDHDNMNIEINHALIDGVEIMK